MEETENYAKMPENQTYFGFGKSKRFIDFDSVLLFLNKNDLMAILFWLFWPVALHQSLSLS